MKRQLAVVFLMCLSAAAVLSQGPFVPRSSVFTTRITGPNANLGTTTSTSGTLNFGTAGSIVARNFGNSADIGVMSLTSADVVRLAYSGTTQLQLGGSTIAKIMLGGTSSSFPMLKVSGNAVGHRLADDTIPAFAALPACASGTEGMSMPVSDSSTAVWGATVTGSSTNHVLAYCNGSAWTVAAK